MPWAATFFPPGLVEVRSRPSEANSPSCYTYCSLLVSSWVVFGIVNVLQPARYRKWSGGHSVYLFGYPVDTSHPILNHVSSAGFRAHTLAFRVHAIWIRPFGPRMSSALGYCRYCFPGAFSCYRGGGAVGVLGMHLLQHFWASFELQYSLWYGLRSGYGSDAMSDTCDAPPRYANSCGMARQDDDGKKKH